MRKYFIVGLLLVSFALKAQETNYNARVDSITYKYYLEGNWRQLVDSSRQAIRKGVDFKLLRQRLGYAYFVQQKYYASQQQYEKAYKFDKLDPITRSYLYYCGLNTGNEPQTRYWGGLLTTNLKKEYQLKPFKLISSVDVEYNLKTNNSSLRGNPAYLRAGIYSQLGYRVSFYQSFATYGQTNKSSYTDNTGLITIQTNDSTGIRQNEYFASLNWTINSHINLSVGYFHLNTTINEKYTYSYKTGSIKTKSVTDTTVNTPGNLFRTGLTYSTGRFDLGLSGSVFTYNRVFTQQYELHAAVALPGMLHIYLKSSVYGMLDSENNNRLIFAQSAGALLLKKLWLEGKVSLGNLNNFSDNNGLYIYNSLDPTTFRTGLSLFWNVLPKLSLFGNYTFDKKLIEDNNTNYYQHSFSTGVIWKL